MSSFEPLAVRTLRTPPVAAFGPGGRALFVVCGYPEGGRTGGGASAPTTTERLFHLPFPRAVDESDCFLKDFYANPRDVAYVASALRDFVSVNQLRAHIDVVADRSLRALEAAAMPGCTAPEMVDLLAPGAWDTGRLRELSRGLYDAVVLVFCDAIGLGCERIADRVAGAPTHARFLLTGRRRVFVLDRALLRALAVRRFFVRTRLTERLLALAAWPVSGLLAAADVLSGK